jgi:phosphoglycerate dehydrogenase-like enzyme
MNNLIAIEPKSFKEYELAVTEAGGRVSALTQDVKAVIWTDYSAPQQLAETLKANPQLTWVQLPFAGVDAFAEVIAENTVSSHPVVFTSAKGCYSEPVAEHALALALALCRVFPERILAKSWGRQFAVSLYESRVLIFGGGGITEELLRLLAPFNTDVTVIRKRVNGNMPGASRTLNFEALDGELPKADVVILAAALTAETTALFDRARFALMKNTSFLVNIARGPMVVSADLDTALRTGVIAGAGIDVTDPEPLPDGHALWSAPNLIITPHSADTRPMVLRLFSKRIRENVSAFLDEAELVGRVDPQLGY